MKEQLKSENSRNGKKAFRAFIKSATVGRRRGVCYDWTFEHGQLWINGNDGSAWSVVDAEGGPAVDGFDFEQVSEPEEF